MFKFRRLLCVALVFAMVGISYGAARKIKSFTTFNEPEGADGMAILTVHDGTGQEVQLILTGFTPYTDYEPTLWDGGNNEYNAFGLSITTNEQGNATWHRDIGTLTLWPCLRIYNSVGNQTGELRAQGCVGS